MIAFLSPDRMEPFLTMLALDDQTARHIFLLGCLLKNILEVEVWPKAALGPGACLRRT